MIQLHYKTFKQKIFDSKKIIFTMDKNIGVDQFGKLAFKNLMDLFILPEIKNRQNNRILPIPFELRTAQIVFFPDNSQKIIRLNEEVKAFAKVMLKQGIGKKKGELVQSYEIEEIKEISLTSEDDPDCAHIFMGHIENRWFLSFDFRYNKALAKKYLNRANEFLESSEFNFSKKNWGAFVDNLFSSSELLATSTLLLSPNPKMRKKTNHHMIKTGFNQYIHNGNLKHEYSEVFNQLAKLRCQGRYISKKFVISEYDAEKYLTKIKQLKDEIDARIK